MNEVTRILSAIDEGDPQHAAEQLLPLVYAELRQLAAQRLAQEKPGQTLEATALVHEAYLRLVASAPTSPLPSGGEGPRVRGVHWHGRGHFFAAAAEAMRRILVENARRKGRAKHGGARQRHDLDAVVLTSPQTPDELVALSEALDGLAAEHPQAAELVKLRFFAGLTNSDAAALLGISPRKGNQLWAYARAWLLESLGHEPL